MGQGYMTGTLMVLPRKAGRTPLFLVFQEGFKPCEWLISGNRFLRPARCRPFRPVGDGMTFVLVVVAVQAKQLPVAAVRRVVVVIVILVMDGEFPEPLPFEFAPAARANPGEQFERALAVTLHPELSLAPGFRNDRTRFFVVSRMILGHRFSL